MMNTLVGYNRANMMKLFRDVKRNEGMWHEDDIALSNLMSLRNGWALMIVLAIFSFDAPVGILDVGLAETSGANARPHCHLHLLGHLASGGDLSTINHRYEISADCITAKILKTRFEKIGRAHV